MCMYKKCVCLISLVFLLGMVGNVSAVDRNWTNTNGNRLWSTAANWSGSVVPTSADKAAIRNSAILGPIINSSTTAVANEIVLGDGSSTKDTLDMTGGTLTTSGANAWVILGYGAANNGIFTLSAGTVTIADNFYVGFSGKGLLQMTGGSITVGLTFGIAQNAGSIADVNLYGGTINANGTFNMTSGGGMDITAGTLIVNGDVSTLINTYKTNGWITAYGGTGVVNVSYNTPNVGKTTVTATPPAGTDRNWTNTNGNRLWSTAANWSGSAIPTSADKAAVRNSAISGPIINTGTTAVANTVVVGDWSSTNDTLDMTGGTLTTNDWFVLGYSATNHGTFTMSAGTANIGGFLYVGNSGTGTLTITGGSITVTGTFGIAQLTGSIGDVFLDGGTITANGTFNMTSGAGMDITTGTLIINGDVTSAINTYKTNGWITAYGGSGTVNVSYNTPNAGKTTVTATSGGGPPGKAANPNPANGATGISTTNDLSWSAGSGATSRDVYFGTTSPGTSRGNQTATTYDTGTMINSKTYYWRINEKNAAGTTTGDVWSFTTTAGSGNYSLVGKVMCGYQGWFNCPSDGTTRGWIHWGSSTSSFTPSNCTVDMWPDMTEMTTGEKFLASSFYDGKDRYVFSSHNLTTVRRHFQWMQQNGIDGVYLQRFATELTPGSAAFNNRNDILGYCKDGANLYGRKYAVMYDLSGLASGGTSKVIADWKYLVDNAKVPNVSSADPAYIFHNGKRVVAVWGIGFSGRAYTNLEVKNLINFLKNDATYGGNVVMIGCQQNWRTNTDTNVKATLLLADIISPWLVGSYKNTSGVNSWATSKGVPDKAWCNTNGKSYLPVMFPGFSWHNKYPGDPLNEIPRVGGQFFWDQVKADISTVGANMLYVAMFDEVDEGTAIFKVTNDPPKPGGATMFVTYEGKPSDEYLWLVGQAGRGLRGEIPVNQTRPAR